jgi:hypothetical protein
MITRGYVLERKCRQALAPTGKLTTLSRKLADPSPERIARANRQRLAQEEGTRAMADIEQQAIAIRKNMERLRALREAKEVQEGNLGAASASLSKKKNKKVVAK